MSVVCIYSRKVSETRRSFKQTCFCDKGPEFSNEANPHLVFYWIRRGYISSNLGAMNLNRSPACDVFRQLENSSVTLYR